MMRRIRKVLTGRRCKGCKAKRGGRSVGREGGDR
jgi:hypothetical protein